MKDSKEENGKKALLSLLLFRNRALTRFDVGFTSQCPRFRAPLALFTFKLICFNTGSPSSKYEHRRASALLRNIQNIRICMGKKPTVSVTYENERISIKNSSPYLKCVLLLSCVVHGPIYGRFIGFYVNGFLSI